MSAEPLDGLNAHPLPSHAQRSTRFEAWLPVSVDRRLVIDLLHFARRIPLCNVERQFDLQPLVTARSNAARRISWSVLFLKAYARVAARNRALRRMFYTWPWPRMYEHDHSVAMLAMNRGEGDTDRLFWGRFSRPEQTPLGTLQDQLDHYKSADVDVAFRKQVQLARLPLPLRRLIWSWNLCGGGAQRAKRLGTFGLSTLAGQKAINRFHPTITTSSLAYGPLDASGGTLVTIIYDHRVVDGAYMARCLEELEAELRGAICHELYHAVRLARSA